MDIAGVCRDKCSVFIVLCTGLWQGGAGDISVCYGMLLASVVIQVHEQCSGQLADWSTVTTCVCVPWTWLGTTAQAQCWPYSHIQTYQRGLSAITDISVLKIMFVVLVLFYSLIRILFYLVLVFWINDNSSFYIVFGRIIVVFILFSFPYLLKF